MAKKGRVVLAGFDAVWRRSRSFTGYGGVYRGTVFMEDGVFYAGGQPLTDPEMIDGLPSPWRELAREQAVAPRAGTIVYHDGTPTLFIDVIVESEGRTARLADVPAPLEWSEFLRELEPDTRVGPLRAEISRTVKDGQAALEIALAGIDRAVVLQDERREYVSLVYNAERKQATVRLQLGAGSR